MLTFVKTTPSSRINIWNSKVQTIILNTNVEGIMTGICRGLDNYDRTASLAYQTMCDQGLVHLGVPILIASTKHQGKQYVFCPIKLKSGDAPKAKALEACLKAINAHGGEWGITSVATHPMGCGSSDIYLSWRDMVHPMMVWYLGNIPVPVTIYGASDPCPPKPVVVEEPEPVTSVMPRVKPIVVDADVQRPLAPVLARAAFDLSDEEFEKIYGVIPF